MAKKVNKPENEVYIAGTNSQIDFVYDKLFDYEEIILKIPLTRKNGAVGQTLRALLRKERIEVCIERAELKDEVQFFEDDGEKKEVTISNIMIPIKRK